jgi:hypothetical protein
VKFKITRLILSLVMGIAVLPTLHAQPGDNSNTAHIDIKGSITQQNPTGWISAVFLQSSDGTGARGVYEVIFHGTAPDVSTCTATPDSADLAGSVEAPDAKPKELLVFFRQLSSNGGVATPIPSAFTLTCASSSS